MARRTKEEAQQTRETILMAALDMFCDKGYSRTTFDEIAKKINLTKGAVYWHFRNKPDIIKALIIEAFERNQAAINREISEVNTLDDLLRYFKYAAQIVKTAPMFRKFLFFVMVGGPVQHAQHFRPDKPDYQFSSGTDCQSAHQQQRKRRHQPGDRHSDHNKNSLCIVGRNPSSGHQQKLYRRFSVSGRTKFSAHIQIIKD